MGRPDACAGRGGGYGRRAVNAGTAVRIRLSGDVLEVSGEDLDTRQLRLFFRGVLGGERIDGGWRVPCRGQAGNELIIRIARRLDAAGLRVEAESDQVDLALKHEVERVRSFGRARSAGQAVSALQENPDLDVPSEAGLLARLEEYGWNSSERNRRPHQVYGLRHAMSAVNSANFSVPGSGKTAVALAVIGCHLATDHIDSIIVVGPLSAFRPWEREAAAALPGKLDVRRVRGLRRDDRIRIWRRVHPGQLLLCSYASAAADRYEIERVCRRLRAVMLIVDESHRVKRFRGGQWASALVDIARLARIRLILTGTPMPQGPLDLWSQFNILWPGEEATGSRLNFRARTDSNFRQVVASLEPFFVRTPKSELGLTPARVITSPVELGSVQREVYELIEGRLRLLDP